MIGDKIYKFRKSKNLSQEDFANSLGVTRQIVSKWESNQSIPLVDKLKKISDVYGIDYEELLKDTEYEVKKGNNIKKYILIFIVMVILQVIFILIVSIISFKNMESDYKCLGTQTYEVLQIYNSDDINYSYVTLKKDDNIKTVKVSKIVTLMISENNKYQFVFRCNEKIDDMEYIFTNNDIINVINTKEDINSFDCK